MKKTILISALILSLLPLGAVYHKIGEYVTQSSVNAFEIVGDFAYIADGDAGLAIINISDPGNPILAGSIDTPGTAIAITVKDSLVYMAERRNDYPALNLLIFNALDTQNPTLLGTDEYVSYAYWDVSITVTDSIAYLLGNYWADAQGAARWQTSIIDVSDPQTPSLVCSVYENFGMYACAFEDSILYVTEEPSEPLNRDYPRMGGFRAYDVSDSNNPVLIGSYATPDSPLDLKISGDIAYIADDSAGLLIIDISNPQNPTLLGSYDTPGDAHSISVAGNTAYVADGTGLQIVDVSIPQNPILLGFCLTEGVANKVIVIGNIAYLTGDEVTGLTTVDVSNAQNPVVLSPYSCAVNNAQIINGIAYLTNVIDFYNYPDPHLQILDVSEPQNVTLHGSYNTTGYAQSVTVEGNIAYVADGNSGLQIVDSSNPQNPVLLSTYDTAGSALNVGVDNNLACVTEADAGFQVIDVSNPQSPFLMGTFPCYARAVDVVDSLAYVTANDGMQIIDISNSHNPVMLSWWIPFEWYGGGRSVDVVNNTAYLIYSGFALIYFYSYLVILDVSNPQDLDVLGMCSLTYGSHSVKVTDDVAYVAGLGSGLQIIDVSNPATPAIINSILPHPTSNINLCYIHDYLLYISDENWNEISVYNINNPQAPVLNNRYAWNLSTNDMCVADNRLFTANGAYGLNILDTATFPVDVDDEVQIPVTEFQMRNYPNPFNSETSISYTLPAKGQVFLSIYNSKGQLIKCLLNEPQAKGEHLLTWNGKDNNGHSVASGLYLCRITSAGKHESRKLLLLK